MPLHGETKRKYQREWVAARRQEFFSDKSCAWCGSTEELELDHNDPAEKISHRIWSWSKPRRDKETSKCTVLCNSCHKNKTKRNHEHAQGDRSGQAKLTSIQVKEIRALYSGGTRQITLASKYNVDKSTISRIVNNKQWLYN